VLQTTFSEQEVPPPSRDGLEREVKGLATTLQDPGKSWQERRSALYALRDPKLRPAASIAVPALIDLLDAELVRPRVAASAALAWLGESSVPALLRAVEDPAKMQAAVESLYRLRSGGMPHVVRLLGHKDTRTRIRAAEMFAKARRGHPDTVPALTKALADKSPEVRAYAARALAKAGPAAEPAVPSIIKSLSDKNSRARAAAVRALGVIQKGTDAAGEPLAAIAADKESGTELRIAAAHALGQLKARSAGPLARILAAPQEARELRAAAARTLGRMGAPAAEPLLRALADPDEQIRWNAAVALSHTPESAAMVTAQLKDGDVLVRRYAAFVLGRMGIRARSDRRSANKMLAALAGIATPVLLSSLRDEAAPVRRNAAVALAEIGCEASVAVSALKKLLSDRRTEVRVAAVQALGKLAKGAESATDDIAHILETSDDRKLQWAAAYALERIKGPRPEIVAAKTIAIHSEILNKYVRMFDGQWQGMLIGSDGNCYFGGGGHWRDNGSAFFRYLPKEQKVEMLCRDITAVCGEDLTKTPPQGKIHSQMVEHDGWLFFGTHLADYSLEGCRAYTGGHLVGYEPATGKFRDYGVVHPNYTNYSGLGIDPKRNLAYIWVTPFAEGDGSYLYRVDTETGERRAAGPMKRTSCQYLFVDSRGDCWFQIGELCRFRAETGEVDFWPGTIPNGRWEERLVLPGGDQCFVPVGDTLYLLDADEDRDSPGAFMPVKRIGRTHHGLAMNSRRLYFARSQRRPRRKGGPRRNDTWLMSMSLDPRARPQIVNHGIMTDQDGRTPHGIWSMEVDEKDRLYMTGRWYVLPGEEQTIGVNRGDGFICLQFNFVDMSAHVAEAPE